MLSLNFNFSEGEYILAIFKGIYYRALCLEVLEDENKTMRNFKVQFIDFGNVTKVKKDIIKLPSILLKHPCIAYLCYVQSMYIFVLKL